MEYLQNKYLKLVVTALIVVQAVYQFVQGDVDNGITLVLLSLFPMLLHFRSEFILLTFLRLRGQDLEGMEKWLNKIADPETALLRKQQRYYNYMYGVIYTRRNLTQAEEYFRKALQLGPTIDYDKAMVKISLVGIMIQKCRKREAQELLAEAKRPDKQNIMTEQIGML